MSTKRTRRKSLENFLISANISRLHFMDPFYLSKIKYFACLNKLDAGSRAGFKFYLVYLSRKLLFLYLPIAFIYRTRHFASSEDSFPGWICINFHLHLLGVPCGPLKKITKLFRFKFRNRRPFNKPINPDNNTARLKCNYLFKGNNFRLLCNVHSDIFTSNLKIKKKKK